MIPEPVKPEPAKKVRRSCVFSDLNTLDYKKALDLQLSFLNAKTNNPLEPDRLLLVEHPQVYTLGRRGGKENLIVSEEFLSSHGIKIVQTDRGGNITFHGPGQAVLYPIIDLVRAGIGVADFVHGMEEVMKQTVKKFNISADRSEKNHGLWVKNKKIGSVGISIKKGISIHGLALNVCLDLTPFSWINPCGLENVAMTSIAWETARSYQSKTNNSDTKEYERNNHKGGKSDIRDQALMNKACNIIVQQFSTIFDIDIIRE